MRFQPRSRSCAGARFLPISARTSRAHRKESLRARMRIYRKKDEKEEDEPGAGSGKESEDHEMRREEEAFIEEQRREAEKRKGDLEAAERTWGQNPPFRVGKEWYVRNHDGTVHRIPMLHEGFPGGEAGSKVWAALTGFSQRSGAAEEENTSARIQKIHELKRKLLRWDAYSRNMAGVYLRLKDGGPQKMKQGHEK